MMTLRRPPRRGFGEQPATLAAIQNLFARGELGGYWPADPAYLYEDSAGTISASLDGVVGLLTNAVTGYPNAIQATTANKPYLRRTPVSNKYWLDSNTYTGALTATFASALGSACTIASVTPEGVSILENQTVGSTYNICPPFGYNGDVLIINRALTAAEKALVTRVMQRNVPTLGSNLIIDPDFDSPALWTTEGNAAVSGGCATFTNAVFGDGTYVMSTNDYSFSTDIFYWIKIKNSSYSSGLLSLARTGFEVIGGFSLINDNFMAKKMNSIIGTKLQLYQVWNGSNLTVSVDSLSIKGIF